MRTLVSVKRLAQLLLEVLGVKELTQCLLRLLLP